MKTDKKEKILRLLLTFLKIGAFTFGGGYAMVPLIRAEVVEKYKWIDDKEMLDMIAIAESTPGPIAVNMATFVGNKVAGVAGSVFATVGVVLPSLVIILIISYFYEEFRANKWVSYAFLGIKAAVGFLLLNSVFRLSGSVEKTPINIAVFSVAFILAVFVKIKAVYIILGTVLFGIITAKANLFIKKGERNDDIL